MNANTFIRQFHRWTSIVFMLAVIANLVALFAGRQEVWIGVVALFPLIALMITGLYMFFRPYFVRRS